MATIGKTDFDGTFHIDPAPKSDLIGPVMDNPVKVANDPGEVLDLDPTPKIDAIDPVLDPDNRRLTFADQWYLDNQRYTGTGQIGWDLNVVGVWADYTGQGISIGILDEGVEGDHPDLDRNYRPTYQSELITWPDGTTHISFWDTGLPDTQLDNHGTQVAGIIAAENNGDGGLVGVAFNASISSLDILDNRPGGTGTSHFDEVMPFVKDYDIVNSSMHVGYHADTLANQLLPGSANFYSSIREAAEQGRDGLGTIIVKSAANDRGNVHPGDANLSNFSNNRYSITVGAVDDTGLVTAYSNPGASLLVSAFGDPKSDAAVERHIATTDRTGAAGVNNSMFGDTTYFGGTSAAAPEVAGVVALMLEANPTLGWRDVQDILAYTARKGGEVPFPGWTNHETDVWQTNGAQNWNGGGLHFSNDYGFGIVDALAAVRLAETWTRQSTSLNEGTVGSSVSGTWSILDPAKGQSSGPDVRIPLQIIQDVLVERIELDLDISHPRMGDVVVELVSPDGTDSFLLENRGGDWQLNRFVFTSNEFRGELSAGTWTLVVRDTVANSQVGTISMANLRVYGNADTINDIYVYTNEFARYAGDGEHGFQPTDADGGVDTINAAAVTSGSVIQLESDDGFGRYVIAGREGFFAVGGGGGPGYDPHFRLIENIIGGDGGDELTGNMAANRIEGGRGADRLDGRGANDILTGGQDSDTFVFGDGWGHDTVTDFELGKDVLDMKAVSELTSFGQLAITDTVNGASIAFGGNSITLNGVSAASLTAASFLFTTPPAGQTFAGTAHWGGTVQGTAGVDTVSYADANYTIYVDLLRDGGYAEGAGQSAHLTSIENITGSSTLLNYLHGNQEDNILIGGDHFDWLVGRGGNNTLDGRGFLNLADYYETDAPVTIDLTLGKAFHSTGTDTLINIQQFRATNSADTFIGDGQDNYFMGANGDDVVNGGAGQDSLNGSGDDDILEGGDGDDELIGGPDNDLLAGGIGADRFVYNDTYPSHDRILDFNFAEGDRIIFTTSTGVDDYFDLTLSDDGAGDALLSYGQSSIVLVGITAGDVRAEWMSF